MRWIASIALRVADKAIDRMFRNHDERIRQLTQSPLLNGIEIKDVDVVVTPGTTVVHSLGRTPIGVLVVRSDEVKAFQIDTFTKTSFRIMCSSGTPTVDLWVY